MRTQTTMRTTDCVCREILKERQLFYCSAIVIWDVIESRCSIQNTHFEAQIKKKKDINMKWLKNNFLDC